MGRWPAFPAWARCQWDTALHGPCVHHSPAATYSTQLVEPIFGPANKPQKIAGKKSDPKMCIPAKIGKVWISINIPFIFHWHIIYEPSIGPWLFHYHPTHHRWPCRCSSRWLRCHDHLCKLLDSHVANPRPAATSASRGHISPPAHAGKMMINHWLTIDYITSRFGACPFFSATPQGWLGQRFVRDKIYLDEMHFRLVHGTQESQRSQA